MSARRAVVVGASIGGVRTVQGLRTSGFDGEVVLIGDESERPYDRPPLSKDELRGAIDARSELLSAEDAQRLGVTLLLGRAAVGLDVVGKVVELAGGACVEYDDVVVATGAYARPSPWGQPVGVHLLRTRSDAQRLRADLVPGRHLVVVGAGFIGAEVAATARSLGLDVTLIDPLAAPMARVLGDGPAGFFAELHQRHGVSTRFGRAVETIARDRQGLHVALSGGEVLHADAVVVGIGAAPNDGWLADAALRVQDGLICDEHCRAIDAVGVHAVGDVARWWHPQYREYVRIEHWTNAVEQAAVVAHNIAHPSDLRIHAPVEYVWSDQYDWKIQIVGRPAGATAAVVGDPDNGRFAIAYGQSHGPLIGLVGVNWPKAIVAARRGIATGGRLDHVVSQLEANAA